MFIKALIRAGEHTMPGHLVLAGVCTWDFWNYRRFLVKALVKAGFRVTVVAASDGYQQLVESIGADVVCVPFKNARRNPFLDVALFLRYSELLRQLSPDVVITYGIKPAIWCGMAARRRGLPYISVVTGLGSAFLSGFFLRSLVSVLYKVALKNASCVWFLNRADEEYFISRTLVSNRVTAVLPGEGVDTDHFYPVDSPRDRYLPITFLFVGRLLKDKGIADLVASVRLLRKIGIPCRCLVLGGVDRFNPSAITEQELDAWVRDGLVEYLGQADDVRPALSEADVVILPSRREGLPRVLLEAGAMKKPAIATRVPGCTDVLVDGVTGWLVEPENPQALMEKMLLVTSLERKTLKEMGAMARAHMLANFSCERVAQQYLERIRILCHDRSCA